MLLNIGNDNIGSAFISTSKLNDSILWHARLGHVHYKRMQDMYKDVLISAFDMDTEKTESRVLRAVVRLPDPKLKSLGEKGIECIFVGYADHFKTFRFYVIEPNDSVLINSIIESSDVIFDENKFSSVSRPSQRPLINRTEDIGVLEVSNKVPLGVIEEVTDEETTDEVFDQHSYCFNVDDDPNAFDEEIKSQDVAFGKEAINYEIDFIMSNNTWVLADLPPVECISTIRLLIALASIHNLIIHQIDVKTAFLNGELDEDVYMNQPQGFIMSGNENKVCKVIKSLYGLKQEPKRWHQKFDEVVLYSNS
ncbi:zinc finger, CCHC-type containing protein [Tanacetum coccineum]